MKMSRKSMSVLVIALAVAVMGEISSASAASRNEVEVFQRGQAEATVDTAGANKTNVTQMGGGRVFLKVDGEDDDTYVVSGRCWPGAPGRPINIRGNHKLNIIIAPCR
jgi:hypothetical protein